MPAARHGEFGFAAGGTYLVTTGKHDAWLATGGGVSRIFHSRDDGRTWVVKRVPIPADPAGAGIFSLAFKNKHVGAAVGGDFAFRWRVERIGVRRARTVFRDAGAGIGGCHDGGCSDPAFGACPCGRDRFYADDAGGARRGLRMRYRGRMRLGLGVRTRQESRHAEQRERNCANPYDSLGPSHWRRTLVTAPLP